MKHIINLLFLVPTFLFAQQTVEWIEKLENPEYTIHELKPENLISNYLNYDFSELLIPETEFLGYIGNEYQRIYVEFTSIRKDEITPATYEVIGFSIVHDNKCDFTGTLKIEQIREFTKMHFGVDNMYEDAGFKSQGLLIGKYVFNENPEQSHVGIFEGIVTLWWYVDKDGNIHFDDLETYSDSYRNNQYVGTWTEYGKSKGKSCNWGEYRIPFSGDLDIGAGEFSVNPKYLKRGWDD